MLQRLILSVCFLVVGGCGTLPDIKPFADATVTMKAAVAGSYDAAILRTQDAVAAVRVIESPTETATALANYEKAITDFNAGRPHRQALLSALVKYADGLAAIVDAGKQAGDSVKAVSSQVQGLVSVFMANPLPGVPVKLTETLLTKAIEIGSLNSLDAALASASPIVEEVVKVLDADLQDIAGAIGTKAAALEAAYRVPYIDQENQRRALILRRDVLLKSIGDPAGTALPAETVQKLRDVETTLSSIDRWYVPLQERLLKVKETAKADEELVTKARALLAQWVAANRDLSQAVKESRKPNVGALVATALEVRDVLSKQ